MMITPILQTKRLILRPFIKDDAQEVFNSWESDPDVAKYMFWTSHSDISKTIEWLASEIEKINSDDWYRWAYISKESGKLLGTGLLYFDDEYKKFEIGYNLGKHAWGYGYATEAMMEVIRFAKDELGIKEIIGRHAKENPASEKVMKKLGFQYVKDIPYECNAGTKIYEGKEYVLKL